MMLIRKDLKRAVMENFKVISHSSPGGTKEIRKMWFLQDMRSSEVPDVPPKCRLNFNGQYGVIKTLQDASRTQGCTLLHGSELFSYSTTLLHCIKTPLEARDSWIVVQ
jgi:hypothetical protein